MVRDLIQGAIKPLMTALMAVLMGNSEGCKEAEDPSQYVNKAYHVELANCVAKSATLEASAQCRHNADVKWEVCAHPEWNLGRCN